AQGSHRHGSRGWHGQGSDGVGGRNDNEQYSAVHSRSARRAACDLGRRDLGSLAVRPTETTRASGGGLQSAAQCLIKGRQQERQDRCAQAGRLIAHGDRADARNLAELLRTNHVHAVYHGNHGTRTLKELGRSYLALTKDSTRVMNRIKSVYRSWAIPCAGTSVYSRRHRAEWLAKLVEPGVRMRAEHLYQELDGLKPLRQAARRELLREASKHTAVKRLRQIPVIGPIRSALLVALLQTPHRFRTKRQLWAYSGFAVQTYDSGEFRFVRGKRQRNRERITVRGLNRNHNPDVKNLLKGGYLRHRTPRAVAGFLCCPGGERDAAQHGPSHPNPEDCRHRFNHVEERSEFRPQTVAATSSLSIAEEAPSIRRVPSAGGRSISRDARFEGSISQ